MADLAQIQKFIAQQPGRSTTQTRRQILAVALLVLVGGGYFLFHRASATQDAPAPPPAATVSALTLTPQSVHPWAEFSGRISAVDYAEIRPQVTGRITEIHFHDGQLVKAGDTLFVIDPRPYQAAVTQAEGNLSTAIENAKLAKIEVDRGARLLKQLAIAQEAYDQRVNADGVAKAAVTAAQGTLAAAKLNVDYAFIKAPISGRISRAEITVGNLVGSPTAPPPLLASIVSSDGVYADFEVDEQTFLNNVRNQAQTQDQQVKIPVDLTVQGDAGAHVYHGTIESFDNHIDNGSGTIRARAHFPNTDGTLVPGMFISVRMGGNVLPNALLVPDEAIGNDQSKRFVFVVGAGGKAEYRPVILGSEVEGKRIITSGLKSGDRVILDGLQRLAPGVPVAVKSSAAAN